MTKLNLPARGANSPCHGAADAQRNALIGRRIATPLEARCAMAFTSFMLDKDLAAHVQYEARDYAFEQGRFAAEEDTELPIYFVGDQELAAAWTAGYSYQRHLADFLDHAICQAPALCW